MSGLESERGGRGGQIIMPSGDSSSAVVVVVVGIGETPSLGRDGGVEGG